MSAIEAPRMATVPMKRLEFSDPNGRPVVIEAPVDYTQPECELLAGYVRSQLRGLLASGPVLRSGIVLPAGVDRLE